jgi:hypothetical protein
MTAEREANSDAPWLRRVDPTLPDRFAEMTRTPIETESTRRTLGGRQEPEMLQLRAPTRMEIERETGVAFFRGVLSALAFSAVVAGLVALLAIATSP